MLRLTSAVPTCGALDWKRGAVGLFWRLTGPVCLSELMCLCVYWQTGCQVHSIRAGGGKPVTVTCLLWFQTPHIPTYTRTHPVPAAALSMGCFWFKDPPKVTFSSTSHSFTWNCTFLEKRGVMLLLPHGFLIVVIWEWNGILLRLSVLCQHVMKLVQCIVNIFSSRNKTKRYTNY